jgi:hypothetical protein
MCSLVNVNINEYDMGIDDAYTSIQVVPTEFGLDEISDSEMINPFFVPMDYYSDYESEIYKKKNVYVICMKDNNKFNQSILYDHVVNKEEFLKACNNISIIQSTRNLLYNNNLKSSLKNISKETLELLFPNSKYNFENEEIVILMFELSESMAHMNISLYDEKYGIEDISSFIQLISYYNGSYKQPVMKQFINHLSNMRESQFWKNNNNCKNINMTDIFVERGFEYKINKNKMFQKSLKNMNKDEGDKLMDILNVNVNQNTNSNKYENYLSKIDGLNIEQLKNDNDGTNENIKLSGEELNKKEKDIKETTFNVEFADIFAAIKKSNKRTYYINNNLTVTQEYINKIFDDLTEEEEIYHMFNMLLTSKDYCHMALHPYILDKAGYLMTKYAPIYKYILGYTWLTMIIEESIMKTKATKNDRFNFDINTASKLPYFPFTYDDIFQNPYVILPVDKNKIDVKNNILSFPCVQNGDQYYGVCTFEQFKFRSNIFLSGKHDIDPLLGLDWKNFGISGSIIPACLQKRSPLMDMISLNNEPEEEQYKKFFKHYYEESDIDLMCYSSTIFDFLNKTEHVVECLDKNLGENTTKIHHEKTMVTHVTKEFFGELLNDFNDKYDKNYDQNEMYELLGKEPNEIHEYLYEIYIKHKFELNMKIRKNKDIKKNRFIQYLLEPNAPKDMNVNFINYDIDKNIQYDENTISFYINDFRKSNPVPNEENKLLLRFGENLKFKIRNEKLLHQIELFRTNKTDFFGMVSRFHLPCVRAYYQGDNVYMTSSCITSMMTSINIDYKYFTGKRDPIDIMNKYRMRGYTMLLSENEKNHMEEYNKQINTFGGMFNTKNGESTVGYKLLGDKIYRPENFKNNAQNYIYHNLNPSYIINLNQFVDHYKTKYNYDSTKLNVSFNMFNFKVINDDGSINPFENWITKKYWENKNI